MDAAPTDAAAEANRMYWETELPVGEIADRLDVSRRALYDAIRPVPAAGQCGSCGAPLQYANRSRRDQGRATCGSCGVETDAPAPPAPSTAPEPEVEPWTWIPQSRLSAPIPTPEPAQSIWLLGAAALAGALLAAGATLAVVRRA